ncbi:MAG TPA: menaquinone biosynthesis protein [Bacteroidia bacterium]|nr:menaquinone biosynthesis protein [Bacteroidia bacterium]
MKHSVSIVNYYNTTPFLYGINHTNFISQIDLQLDIPSVCAQKLKNKQVEIGLVPVAILPELDHYHIITDYCIGAVGKVDSVKLFSEKPLNELTHVLLDYQSKTSVTLVQVLNKHFWKKNIQFINATEGFEKQISGTTGAVIIGDRTFGLTEYAYQYDLAEEWQNFTDLPFVFACWVSNVKLENDFITEFNKTLAYGVNHIEEAVKEKPNNTKGFDALDYLKNKISYNLDSDKKKALEKFLELMK